MALDKGARNLIREVWRDNFEEEMAHMRSYVDKYPIVTIDTEFPGTIARPQGQFRRCVF